MKELDVLLLAYLEEQYEGADDKEKAAFCALLALPDTELVGYLLQRQTPESESLTRVVDHILGRTAS